MNQTDPHLLSHIFSIPIKVEKPNYSRFKPSKKIAALKTKYPHIVESISDERNLAGGSDDHDGIWIYLKPGYMCYTTETHVVHEWTIKDCLSSFENVDKCDCEDCKYELTKERKQQ